MGMLESPQSAASLLDPPNLLERSKVDLKAASRIDLRNEEDIGVAEGSSHTVSVVADKPLNGAQATIAPMCNPAIDRSLLQRKFLSEVIDEARCVQRVHVGAHHLRQRAR